MANDDPPQMRKYRSVIKGEKIKVFGDRPIEPGFAQSEPPEPEEPRPKGERPRAHYEGLNDAEAAEVWQRETLCLGCYHAPVCRHFQGANEALVVVSRCLAYIPAPRG